MLNTIRKLHTIQTPEQRRHYIFIQIVFALAAVIQVAGVASLAPFIALLANPESIHTNPITNYLFNFLNCTSDKQFLMYFAATVMAFIVLSNAVAALSNWLMFWFTSRIGAELQSSTYKSYLNKDFVYYGRNNSSKMVSVLTQEIPRYIYNVLQPFLNLSAQLFVGAIIVVGLIYIDVVLAIVACLIVGGGYLLVFKLLKERLVSHGENLWRVSNQRLKLLNESLGGIKEIRLLGSESIYSTQFDQSNKSTLRSQALLGLSGDLPKFIIETIAFCGLLALALYLLSKHGNSTEVISILSLYAMAGYKLLPAAQTIYKSISQIKANGGTISTIYADVLEGRSIPDNKNSTVSPLHFQGAIRICDATYKYPDADADALKAINLTIPQNSIVAFVGTSGAGKSTLADLILGMLPPDTGQFFAGDIEINKANVVQWQRNVGYVPQNIFIIDDTIKANIAFGVPSKDIDMEKVRKAARMANIGEFIELLPEQYNYAVGERGALLSGGQRQRIGIARALYHDASVLILDEATSALDSVTESEVIATINNLKPTKTIIMIAHRLSTIKAADIVVMMEKGEIKNIDTFDGLSNSSKKFREMLHLVESQGDHAPALAVGATSHTKE